MDTRQAVFGAGQSCPGAAEVGGPEHASPGGAVSFDTTEGLVVLRLRLGLHESSLVPAPEKSSVLRWGC